METSRIVAELPRIGHVRACDAGCIHATLGEVTLNFSNRAALLRFTEYLRDIRQNARTEEIHIRYRWIILCLDLEMTDEMLRLFTAASDALDGLLQIPAHLQLSQEEMTFRKMNH
jgi:hypothetical protein